MTGRNGNAVALSLVLAAVGAVWPFARAWAQGQAAPPSMPADKQTPASQRPAPAAGTVPAPLAATPASSEADNSEAVASDEAEAAATSAQPSAGADATSGLQLTGYIDAGFAKAQGDGTSYPPNDFRLPADYGVDTFATAVNSRGDVASADSGGRFVNGFLPRSAGIGGRASFLLNVMNADLRYTSSSAPLFVFARAQLIPRLTASGNTTEVLLDQAFGRFTPFEAAELTVSVGKFDSVFGVEYLDNSSNIRVGITPSLIARYTTGRSVGAKLFYRKHIPVLWSAFSLNTSATNSGTMVESLQGPDASLTGVPVVSARLGYELNLPRFTIKLGASGMQGPRNDQRDPASRQRMFGLDARVALAGLTVTAEYIHADEEAGSAPKLTGTGTFPLASAFHARGFYVQAAYAFLLAMGALKRVTVYGRVEQRHAWFEGFIPFTGQRATGGLRLDLWHEVALKGEALLNRERAGAPEVANNVLTSSLVYTW